MMMNQTATTGLSSSSSSAATTATRSSSGQRPLGPPWLTPRKQRTLVILPRISGFLSMFGSGWIIYEVVCRGSCGSTSSSSSRSKKFLKNTTTYHRLLLAMSITDFLSSFWMFIGSWAVPKELNNELVLGASGTIATCTAQGFFNQLGMIATGIYSSSLAAYYLLVIRYGWKEDRIQKNAEIWMHAVPLIFGLSTALSGVVLDLYNMALFSWCFIAASPPGCIQSYEVTDGDRGTTCTRGDNATIYIHAFFQCPIWICIVFITVSTYLVYKKVWEIDKRAERWNAINKHSRHNAQNQKFKRRSRQVAKQGLFFVFGFYMTWLVTVAHTIAFHWFGRRYWPTTIAMTVTLPLQGFWNFLVYMRPRFIRIKEQHQDWNIFRVLKNTFFFFPLKTQQDDKNNHHRQRQEEDNVNDDRGEGNDNDAVVVEETEQQQQEDEDEDLANSGAIFDASRAMFASVEFNIVDERLINIDDHHDDDECGRKSSSRYNNSKKKNPQQQGHHHQEANDDTSMIPPPPADCCCADEEDDNNVFVEEVSTTSRAMFASSSVVEFSDDVLNKNQNVVVESPPLDDTQQQGDSERIETKKDASCGDYDGICFQQKSDNSSSTTLFFSSTQEDSLNNNKEKDSSQLSSHNNKKRVSFSPSKLLDPEEEEESE